MNRHGHYHHAGAEPRPLTSSYIKSSATPEIRHPTFEGVIIPPSSPEPDEEEAEELPSLRLRCSTKPSSSASTASSFSHLSSFSKKSVGSGAKTGSTECGPAFSRAGNGLGSSRTSRVHNGVGGHNDHPHSRVGEKEMSPSKDDVIVLDSEDEKEEVKVEYQEDGNSSQYQHHHHRHHCENEDRQLATATAVAALAAAASMAASANARNLQESSQSLSTLISDLDQTLRTKNQEPELSRRRSSATTTTTTISATAPKKATVSSSSKRDAEVNVPPPSFSRRHESASVTSSPPKQSTRAHLERHKIPLSDVESNGSRKQQESNRRDSGTYIPDRHHPSKSLSGRNVGSSSSFAFDRDRQRYSDSEFDRVFGGDDIDIDDDVGDDGGSEFFTKVGGESRKSMGMMNDDRHEGLNRKRPLSRSSDVDEGRGSFPRRSVDSAKPRRPSSAAQNLGGRHNEVNALVQLVLSTLDEASMYLRVAGTTDSFTPVHLTPPKSKIPKRQSQQLRHDKAGGGSGRVGAFGAFGGSGSGGGTGSAKSQGKKRMSTPEPQYQMGSSSTTTPTRDFDYVYEFPTPGASPNGKGGREFGAGSTSTATGTGFSNRRPSSSIPRLAPTVSSSSSDLNVDERDLHRQRPRQHRQTIIKSESCSFEIGDVLLVLCGWVEGKNKMGRRGDDELLDDAGNVVHGKFRRVSIVRVINIQELFAGFLRISVEVLGEFDKVGFGGRFGNGNDSDGDDGFGDDMDLENDEVGENEFVFKRVDECLKFGGVRVDRGFLKPFLGGLEI
ncbi:hypothetical protein HDU76_011049 [Blyttiomyces sp. JEL0837]|nr:hypothetical protein HDU76_011049 [Blyttiomyces sp. JEL0837]